MNDGFVTIYWNKYLDLFSENQKDIYFTEEYVKLYETDVDKAECFIFIQNNNCFLFPYLKRKINITNEKIYDFETQYGYGGPIANTNDWDFIENAQLSFIKSCEENNIIAGFVRFHPLLNNYKLLENKFSVIYDRKTIAIDLSLNEEDIWINELHSKHRNVIKKAQQNGLQFEIDDTFKTLDIFIELYNQTMNKVKADNYYYFDDGYYQRFITNLKSNSFIGMVRKGNEIIASSLFMYSDCYGHYHLSGSDHNYLSLYPNNFLLYNTALFLKQKGVKLFHLGGGNANEPDNTLYKFKQRFSKNNFDFYIGKLIINKPKYDEVCNIWDNKNILKKEKKKNLLLKYRYYES